jgi:hypothetical protein
MDEWMVAGQCQCQLFLSSYLVQTHSSTKLNATVPSNIKGPFLDALIPQSQSSPSIMGLIKMFWSSCLNYFEAKDHFAHLKNGTWNLLEKQWILMSCVTETISQNSMFYLHGCKVTLSYLLFSQVGLHKNKIIMIRVVRCLCAEAHTRTVMRMNTNDTIETQLFFSSFFLQRRDLKNADLATWHEH